MRASRAGRAEASAVLGSDLLARLPIELHIMLLEYMDPHDAVVAMNASKTLRNVWLSEDVWSWLAERWYPGLSGAVLAEAARARQMPTWDCSTGEKAPGVPRRGDHKMGSRVKGGPRPVAPEPHELFRQMLGKLCRRNGGGPYLGSALHHGMQLTGDPIFALSRNLPREQGGIHATNDLGEDLLEGSAWHGSLYRFMMYSNGRIAWWPNAYAAAYVAVVDDLRTTKRRIYRFPDHGGVQRGYKTAMSTELLVMARDRTLHAWHFDRDVLATAVVPEQFERCIAEGSSVLVVTRSAQLYAWTFGGPLERIHLGGLDCYQPGPVRVGGLSELPLQPHSPTFYVPRREGLLLKEDGMLLDFIIHPCLEAVLFVVTMHTGNLVVHETDHGKLVRSYPLHTVTKTSAASAERWRNVNEYLRWEKCDSYGGYRLFSVYLGPDSELSPSDLQSQGEAFCTCGQTTGLVSVCFNIYTRCFNVQCHHFLHSHGRLDPMPTTFHLWSEKLYTGYVPSAMQTGMPVTALRCCPASQASVRNTPGGGIPIYTPSEISHGLLARQQRSFPGKLSHRPDTREEPDAWRRQVDFGLDVTMTYASDSVRSHEVSLWNWDKPSVHQTQTLVGDDDFLIYMVDGVYTAWSFGDEIRIPKETVKWAPWRRA